MDLLVTLPRRLTTMVAGVALLAAPALAQQITTSLSAVGGVPHGEFQDDMSRVGFGVSGLVLYGFGPIAAGIEVGTLVYDHRAFPMDPAISSQSGFLGDVTTTSSIGQAHAVLRLQLPEGPIRPYVDGLVGFQRFVSKTQFSQHVVVGGASIFYPAGSASMRTTSLDADDLALSYGAGGGILFRVASGTEAGIPFDAFLDVGARYIFGHEATYRAVDIRRDGTPVVEFTRSRTDMIRPQIGLVIQFGG